MGDLNPFKPDVSLVESPLLLPESVSDAHQHEDSAIVVVVLLGIVVSHH